MKVCIFTQQFGTRWSGVGTYATNLAAGLIKRGVDVTVVCPTGMHSEVDGAKILEVAIKGWEHKVNYWLPLAWRFALLLRTIPRGERFDAAHFTDAREALFASKYILPLVGTVNDYYPAACPLNPIALKQFYNDWQARWLYWRAVRALEPLAYKKLDGVAANTKFVAEIISKTYRIERERIEVINYGVDEIGVDAPIVLDGSPSVLFVGANFQRKGLPDLIRAAASAKSSLPGIMLHVIGDDAKADAMKSLAAGLGVAPNVKFLGGRPNEEVRRMKPDIFAMPSLIEGFGIVFLEAMLAGAPVIGGRTGGTVELIEDGVNGFTVAPGDVDDLSRKIILLAGDEKLREKIIAAGKETARQYTIGKMVDKTLDLYRKAVARN